MEMRTRQIGHGDKNKVDECEGLSKLRNVVLVSNQQTRMSQIEVQVYVLCKGKAKGSKGYQYFEDGCT